MEKCSNIVMFKGYFDSINSKFDALKTRDLLIFVLGFVTFLKINQRFNKIEAKINSEKTE